MRNEDRIPYDYHEILATLAPRPLLVVASTWYQYNSFEEVNQVVDQVKNVYNLYDVQGEIQLIPVQDYNRFSPKMKSIVVKWAKEYFQ